MKACPTLRTTTGRNQTEGRCAPRVTEHAIMFRPMKKITRRQGSGMAVIGPLSRRCATSDTGRPSQSARAGVFTLNQHVISSWPGAIAVADNTGIRVKPTSGVQPQEFRRSTAPRPACLAEDRPLAGGAQSSGNYAGASPRPCGTEGDRWRMQPVRAIDAGVIAGNRKGLNSRIACRGTRPGQGWRHSQEPG